jgi:putative peptidoglycan lipid II flippase
VFVAAGALLINIALNFYVVPRYGIVGLAAATAITATLNVLSLYTILQLRGWFHLSGKLAGRIARQLVATAVMGALLWWLTPVLEPFWRGGALNRIWSLAALVAAGGVVFFATAYLVGALDKDLVAQLRRKRPAPVSDQSN